ncbi:MAG: sulfurtransferase [Chloroflexi bacterium]|nr:sulfurtransferase [Chloroflexota bacterium]
MPEQLLVDLDWLDQRPGQVLLVDARLPGQFRRGRLPGAIHLDTFPYANARTDPAGMEVIQRDWARMLGEAGIRPEDTVVFYDAGTENRAPRGAFMLRYLGHERSYVLHGGVDAWLEAGRDLVRDTPARAATPGVSYPINPRGDMVATADDVMAAIGDPSVTVLDNRETPEYEGTRRLQWNPRMGRIPGGVAHVQWFDLLEDRKYVKDPDEARALLVSRGVTPDKPTIIYCQKSHRATNTYAVLQRLGFPNLRVYVGSFREWSRRPELPVERPARPKKAEAEATA